jgi:4-amino-4-deoxy-L-arabinose transferase-like glycosyltransferase
LAVVVVSFCILLAVRFEPAVGTFDGNGYFAQGSLLAQTGRLSFEPECGLQYIGMHWLLGADGRCHPRYSAGLALPVAVLYKFFGHRAAILLNPVLSLLTLAAAYLVVRKLSGNWWAVVAVVLLAWGMPLYAKYALNCLSHMATACFALWAMFLFLTWYEEGRAWQAFAGGMAAGCVPAIRYPEALLGLAVMALLGLKLLRRPRPWRQVLAAGCGALVPIAPILAINRAAYGGIASTGYSLSGEQTGFGLEPFLVNAPVYGRALLFHGLGPLLVFGIAGIAVMLGRKRHLHAGLFLLLGTLPTCLLYMAYFWVWRVFNPGNLRVVFVPMCLLVVASAYALSAMFEGRSRWCSGISVALLLAVMFFGLGGNAVTETRTDSHRRRILALATGEVERHIAPGDVIIGHPRLLLHLDYVRRWKLADSMLLGSQYESQRRFWRRSRDKVADPTHFRRWQRVEGIYGGMSRRARDARQAADLARWAGDGDVYFVGGAGDVRLVNGPSFWPARFEPVASLELPAPWDRPNAAPPVLAIHRWHPPAGLAER